MTYGRKVCLLVCFVEMLKTFKRLRKYCHHNDDNEYDVDVDDDDNDDDHVVYHCARRQNVKLCKQLKKY